MVKLDWEKPDDYAFTEDLSPSGWAWEFLRRNEEYVADYNKFRSDVRRHEKCYGPEWWKNDETKTFIPEKLAGEDKNSWRRQITVGDGPPPRVVPFETWRAEQWGLNGLMFDPSKGLEQGVKFLPVSGAPFCWAASNRPRAISRMSRVARK